MKHYLPKIVVETLKNGYGLKFEGMLSQEGYMYYTVDDLLKGFMIHIGCNISGQLDMTTVDEFIDAAIRYKDNEVAIKEIKRLRKALEISKAGRNGMARRLMADHNALCRMVTEINDIAQRHKADKELYGQLKAATKSYSTAKPLSLKSLGVTKEIEDDDYDHS